MKKNEKKEEKYHPEVKHIKEVCDVYSGEEKEKLSKKERKLLERLWKTMVSLINPKK